MIGYIEEAEFLRYSLLMTANILPRCFLGLFAVVLVWSGITPYDRFTWFLEVAPALIGVVILLATYQRFRLTNWLYGWILVHAVVLCIGGRYTYALVPIGEIFKDIFQQSRNNYDKLGHLMQGFVPALITREIFIRLQVIQRKAWIPFVTICISLAISAFYELIEWWVALATGEGADAFLGTQGYVWDTQSDISYALIGSLLALLTTRLHDRKLAALALRH